MAINYNNVGQELNKADYIVRLIAFLTDTVILGTFMIVVNLVMIVSSYLCTGTIFWGSAGFHISLMLLIVFICSVLYSVVSISVWGATIGKSLMGIEVVTIQGRELTFKQIICREFIGRTLCKLSLFAGFAMVFYNEEGFGFHDKLANTMVVKKGENFMELAVGKEILKDALLKGSDEERYNRIYNRGINAKLSGGAVEFQENQMPATPIDPSQLRMQMSQFAEQAVVPQQMLGFDIYGQQQQNINGYGVMGEVLVEQQMPVMLNDGFLNQEIYMEQTYEMGVYQDALQSVVEEHSLMEECQQHLQFHT